MAIKEAKNNDEPKTARKISILAKKPAKGGTPAKLKKARRAVKPTRAFEWEIDAKSIRVLLLSIFVFVSKDKTIDQIQRLVNM